MPRLAKQVVPEAPSVTLQMLDYPSGEVFRLLSDGFTDAAVDRETRSAGLDHAQDAVPLVYSLRGGQEPSRAETPSIKPGTRIPPEVFCEIPQVMLSMDGGKTGTVDSTLKEHGPARQWR